MFVWGGCFFVKGIKTVMNGKIVVLNTLLCKKRFPMGKKV